MVVKTKNKYIEVRGIVGANIHFTTFSTIDDEMLTIRNSDILAIKYNNNKVVDNSHQGKIKSIKVNKINTFVSLTTITIYIIIIIENIKQLSFISKIIKKYEQFTSRTSKH